MAGSLDFSLQMTGVDFRPCRDPATHHEGKKWVGIKADKGRTETKLLHLFLKGRLLKMGLGGHEACKEKGLPVLLHEGMWQGKDQKNELI